jgi:hypothetical protein
MSVGVEWPNEAGQKGFAAMWAVASEAERVIGTTHPVATNPSRHGTTSLPFQNESGSSSIAIQPCPWGLLRATIRYIGRAPKSGSSTMSLVAMGDGTPAAARVVPGM